MRVFLLAGKARSGKGEVAKVIKNYYDKKKQKTVITEYSKYIKLFAKEMTDWDGNSATKPRKFLQDMGVYIRKNLEEPEFLIRRMKEDLKIYEKFYDNCIISDIRYPNEIEEMKKINPNIISIFIINEHGNYDLSKEEANHETEHALDNYHEFDFVIVNEEKELLEQKLMGLLKEID